MDKSSAPRITLFAIADNVVVPDPVPGEVVQRENGVNPSLAQGVEGRCGIHCRACVFPIHEGKTDDRA